MADFSNVRKEECRKAKLPEGCSLGGSRTVVMQSVLNEIKEHGRSSMHKEVCGVLVGSLCWDGGPYLLIDGRIEGKHASHQSGSVTFTSETWDYIHDELAAKHPERIIVGWYHTHPGFGIFLSNMDAFIHENFFSFPWQPAYVFDPQAETDGFFFRVGTELVQEDVCVSADVPPAIKVPFAKHSDPVKVVVKKAPRRCYMLLAAVCVSACCIAAVLLLSLKKIRDTEQTAKEAETKAEELLGVLADKDSEIKSHQIERQRAATEWNVRKDTYERELNGLRIEVTTITTAHKDLEASNREKQTAVERLKSERANLEEAIREREAQIAKTNVDAEKAKSDLAIAKEQIRQQEQRIAELEKHIMELELIVKEKSESHTENPLCQTNPDFTASCSAESHTKDERPWYKFW